MPIDVFFAKTTSIKMLLSIALYCSKLYFNSFLEKKIFDDRKINDLKNNLKKNIDKIIKISS